MPIGLLVLRTLAKSNKKAPHSRGLNNVLWVNINAE